MKGDKSKKAYIEKRERETEEALAMMIAEVEESNKRLEKGKKAQEGLEEETEFYILFKNGKTN
jgi:hypothetical protein